MNTTSSPVPSPFVLLAHEWLERITEKSLLSGSYVRVGRFLMVSQALFETGVIAGRIFHDRLPLLMKLFAEAGKEESLLEFLGECAARRLAAVEEQCLSFQGIFFLTEMRKQGLPEGGPGSEFVRVARKKIPVSRAFLQMQSYGLEGIGFGYAYYELSLQLLEKPVGPVDPNDRSKLRSHGVDIPEMPPQTTLGERELMVRGLFAEHVSQFRPDLLALLGLQNSA
jgi:hypothetical protein